MTRVVGEVEASPTTARQAPLTVDQVLAWADQWHARCGQWPTKRSGPIPESLGERWSAVNNALYNGSRGLPKNSSLARLLQEHRGTRNRGNLAPLNERQIVAWAKAHHRRTGKWPQTMSGLIPNTLAESWLTVHQALQNGRRGLRGGNSLARLLHVRCGAPYQRALRRLTEAEILQWVDAHHQRTGEWPRAESGKI